jgi:DNA-directed RNA polymerase specialized sigma24 family protein
MLKDTSTPFERRVGDDVVCQPQYREVHFSALHPHRLNSFAEKDAFPWSSTEYNLTLTSVFVERFFERRSDEEIAERHGMKRLDVAKMYHAAVQRLTQVVAALDARQEGLKCVRLRPFTDVQKAFLLVYVFGFNQTEAARMLKLNPANLCRKLRPLAERYGEGFGGAAEKSK